jgi:hypothetical protein
MNYATIPYFIWIFQNAFLMYYIIKIVFGYKMTVRH